MWLTAALQRTACTLALSTALFCTSTPGHAVLPAELMAPPQWVMTDNGAELQRLTDANSKLTDKAARRVFDSGLELANKGADEESQTKNDATLRKAEERFALLIDELSPNFYGAYTNRANVRVARGNLAGAVQDYEAALRLAPLANDVWVTYLNLGSTLLAAERPSDALPVMQLAVKLSKEDRLALLGRGSVMHALGQWSAAVNDYGAALAKAPTDIQPFWLRYSLELYQFSERRPEALGVVRRVAAKFDIEPETQLAACSLLWADGSSVEREEALRRWNYAPLTTRRSMAQLDVTAKQWPPAAIAAAREFRAAAPPVPPDTAEPSPTLTPQVVASASAPAPAPLPAVGAAGDEERATRLEEIRQLKEQLSALQAKASADAVGAGVDGSR